MADVVHKIPYELSGTGGTGAGQYQLSDYEYDYVVGGIPFLSGISDERPYTERMADIKKDQFDNFAEPGEQSLQGWWLRSQSTFTGGAGVLYQDPDNDNQFNFRFATSLGIDPWTAGQVKLLRHVSAGTVSAEINNRVQGYVRPDGTDAYWEMDLHNLRSRSDAGFTPIVTASPDSLFDLTSTGSTYIYASSAGVYTGNNVTAPTQQYAAVLTDAVIEFVKDRVIIGTGRSLIQLELAPSGAPVAGLPTPATYMHPDPNWRWRSITDGPTAIYVAGDSGTTSQIHKLSPTLSSSGVPELTWTGVTATMPTGEQIRTIYSYIGSFVGIATNKGFRVGEIDAQGDISYGPLLFEPTNGCTGITGFDRFMWTGTQNDHDGRSGLYRVDLGNIIQEQTTRAVRYAYARDIYFDGAVNMVTSVSNFGATDRIVFAVHQTGTAKEDAATLVESGFLDTGRIRYNTEEPKLYKFFSIRTPSPLEGDLSVALLSEGGGVIPYITFSPSSGAGTRDIATPTPAGPQNWVAFRFTLERGDVDPTIGAILNGWQVKALPGSIRQRLITQVFQLFNFEQDKNGQNLGTDDFARTRFESFKALARAGDVVLFQELSEGIVTQVVIDDWEFRQSGPPGVNGRALGGYLTVVLRTVAEST